jgi:hypothetical protein
MSKGKCKSSIVYFHLLRDIVLKSDSARTSLAVNIFRNPRSGNNRTPRKKVQSIAWYEAIQIEWETNHVPNSVQTRDFGI